MFTMRSNPQIAPSEGGLLPLVCCRWLCWLLLLVTLAAMPATARALGNFDIELNPGAVLTSNTAALAAFNRAAADWESRISDSVKITINADMGTFDNANIIGSTSTTYLSGDYDEIRNQLVADSVGKPGKSIILSLPTAATFSAYTTGLSLSSTMMASKANLKAMGFGDVWLDAEFGVSDGAITFNQAFNFDYDRSDGITAGYMDFETVACHEIGHALGFLSGVDLLSSTQTTAYITPLDLYRFRANEVPTNASNFATLPRSIELGVDSVLSDGTQAYEFSTGAGEGDGNQASHWKDDEQSGVYVGIMDPTLAAGVTEMPTEADFLALSLIGYDIAPEEIPEPGSVGLEVAGALVLCAAWRRKRAA